LKILIDENDNNRQEVRGQGGRGKRTDGRRKRGREAAGLMGKARHSKESFYGMFFALIYADKR